MDDGTVCNWIMERHNRVSWGILGLVFLLPVAGCSPVSAMPQAAPATSVNPVEMPRVGTVDARYQSYNVEMLEVTGGEFWRPYESKAEDATTEDASPPSGSGGAPAGIPSNLYAYRPPIDLSDARLRTLARALAPAYMRVSGTWANTTYVPAEGEELPDSPPSGYGGILTPGQWKGVVDFSEAVDAAIVTSFAIGPGVRAEDGTWTRPSRRAACSTSRRQTAGPLVRRSSSTSPTWPSWAVHLRVIRPKIMGVTFRSSTTTSER